MDNLNTVINRHDLYEGSIMKIYQNDTFEGWGRLIHQRGGPMTFINNNAVYVNESWLVEFIPVHEVREALEPKDRFNQMSLSGFRTHRCFTYFGEHTWERYIARYGVPQDTYEPPQVEDDSWSKNDKNFIF